jgi:hypothetical protein
MRTCYSIIAHKRSHTQECKRIPQHPPTRTHCGTLDRDTHIWLCCVPGAQGHCKSRRETHSICCVSSSASYTICNTALSHPCPKSPLCLLVSPLQAPHSKICCNYKQPRATVTPEAQSSTRLTGRTSSSPCSPRSFSTCSTKRRSGSSPSYLQQPDSKEHNTAVHQAAGTSC